MDISRSPLALAARHPIYETGQAGSFAMNWMTWLVGRCVDLTERVVPGLERREPGRAGTPPPCAAGCAARARSPR